MAEGEPSVKREYDAAERLSKDYARKDPKLSNRKERTRLRNQSHKQEVKDAYWAGMKAMALHILGPEATCGFCSKGFRSDEPIDADHILPRGRGGRNIPENMRLCHRRCHQRHHGIPWPEEGAS